MLCWKVQQENDNQIEKKSSHQCGTYVKSRVNPILATLQGGEYCYNAVTFMYIFLNSGYDGWYGFIYIMTVLKPWI